MTFMFRYRVAVGIREVVASRFFNDLYFTAYLKQVNLELIL
jgi:hypothetical protein